MELETLFDRVYPSLFRYCHRLTGDPDAADDAAQEAFVRLVEHEVDGEPAQLRVWLFKVATHLIRDRVRVAKNRRRLLEIHPVRPAGEVPPDRRAERAEAVAAVRRALDELSERDRTLLLMREEGFSYREMAEAAGVAPGSVGTLLARAQQRLAEAYGKEHEEHGDDDASG